MSRFQGTSFAPRPGLGTERLGVRRDHHRSDLERVALRSEVDAADLRGHLRREVDRRRVLPLQPAPIGGLLLNSERLAA
jgi:hypothetical protein